jgi:hypothetical protein
MPFPTQSSRERSTQNPLVFQAFVHYSRPLPPNQSGLVSLTSPPPKRSPEQ